MTDISLSAAPVLKVRELRKYYGRRRNLFGQSKNVVYAVDGVSFDIAKGETLALVGESGCGKSTVARSVLRLVDVTDGEVTLLGHSIEKLGPSALRPLRKHIQVVFQDPFSSLNPRMRIGEILAEPIRNYGLANGSSAINKRVAELLTMVRLPASAANRFPHQFSGGQRQRIGIARALAAEPDLIVCDESVSALDVSVQAQIINLLKDLQRDLGLSLLFISHDLAVVENLSHRVAVMYLGRIVEIGSRGDLFGHPHHPYTQALLSAVPVPDPRQAGRRIVLKGDVPSPLAPPSGCHFHPRCPYAFDRCRVDDPALRPRGNGQFAACHLDELPETGHETS